MFFQTFFIFSDQHHTSYVNFPLHSNNQNCISRSSFYLTLDAPILKEVWSFTISFDQSNLNKRNVFYFWRIHFWRIQTLAKFAPTIQIYQWKPLLVKKIQLSCSRWGCFKKLNFYCSAKLAIDNEFLSTTFVEITLFWSKWR